MNDIICTYTVFLFLLDRQPPTRRSREC